MKNPTLILILLFVSFNYVANSEEATFETITKALNYSGDKEAVTKLVITGEIQGNDYSPESE
jgi:hypothetical protein